MRFTVRRLLALLAAVGCLALILSCGGGGGPTTGTGRFTVAWEIEAARLIPTLTQSIEITVNRGATEVATRSLTRPADATTSSVELTLEPGAYTATFVGYPAADNTGTPQGMATVNVTITAGQTTPIAVDLNSTVNTFEVDPPTAALTVGGATQVLTATARNLAGDVVLIPPVTWTADPCCIVTLVNSRQTTHQVTLAAQSAGNTTVTASVLQQTGDETSRLTANVPVTVSPAIVPAENGLLLGRVFDQQNRPLGDAFVALLGAAGRQVAEVRTNADGYFSLGEVPSGNHVLRVTKDGYVSASRPVTVAPGTTNRVIVNLLQAGVTVDIDTTQENTVTHRGGSVVLPANGIVNGRGRQVNTATVQVTTLMPSDPNYTRTFPGAFEGIPTGSRQTDAVPLLSYGVVDAELRDVNGDPLNLAPGQTAEVIWPIDPATDPGTPTIPIWYLDPETGRWIQDGVATRDEANMVYRGTVTHFTPWNLDAPVENSGTKRVTVTIDGEPAIGVPVRIEGDGWAVEGVTDGNGECELRVAPGERANVFILNADNEWQLVAENETMPEAGETLNNSFDSEEEDIDLGSSCFVATLRWGASPSDLDSHLTVPPFGERILRYHVYYGDEGRLDRDPFANLDTDDTTSYGPEVVTVRRCLPGVYRYTIHQYSSDGSLQTSEASVTLVTHNGIIRTYTPPTDNPDGHRYWAVFEVVVDELGVITEVRDLNRYGGSDELLTEANDRHWLRAK